MECLTPTVSFDIFMDTSFRQLSHLGLNSMNETVTPLRFLELLFEDILVDMIFVYTKLYGHTEKVDTRCEITNEKIRLFFSINFFTNILSYIKQYSIVRGQIHVTLYSTYLLNNENYNSIS